MPHNIKGELLSGAYRDQAEAGPSTRPPPGSRRRNTSNDKSVRFRNDASTIQRPTGGSFDDAHAAPNLASTTLRSPNAGADHDSTSSLGFRPSPMDIDADEPKGNNTAVTDYSKEVEVQLERELAQPLSFSLGEAPATEGLALCAVDAEDDNGKDVEVCKAMACILQSIKDLAARSGKGPDNASIEQKRAYMSNILARNNEQLVRYVGCLAIGGPQGKDGWAELLYDQTCRAALIIGIFGRALKEKVFGDLWFGGNAEQKKALYELEACQVDKDGFHRTKHRAAAISKFPKLVHDVDLERESAKVTLQLEALVAPLLTVIGQVDLHARLQMRHEIRGIVDQAATLSRAIRRAGDVVYYWTPVYKDEEFEPSRMECLNLTEMILQSPYERETLDGWPRAILQDGLEAKRDALVRVVCFPGLQAYRQGGGTLAKTELASEKLDSRAAPADVQREWQRYDDAVGARSSDDGCRSKIVCKSVVLLHWGQQRLLTREAGTSRHIKAVQAGQMTRYEQDVDGFVELYDVAVQAWSSSSQ